MYPTNEDIFIQLTKIEGRLGKIEGHMSEAARADIPGRTRKLENQVGRHATYFAGIGVILTAIVGSITSKLGFPTIT